MSSKGWLQYAPYRETATLWDRQLQAGVKSHRGEGGTEETRNGGPARWPGRRQLIFHSSGKGAEDIHGQSPGPAGLDYSQGALRMRKSINDGKHWSGAVAPSPARSDAVSSAATASKLVRPALGGQHRKCAGFIRAHLDQHRQWCGLEEEHLLTIWRLLDGAIWCWPFRAYIGRRQLLRLSASTAGTVTLFSM